MTSVLVCLCLLSLCFATRRFVGLSVECTPVVVLSSAITILYFFSYFSLLSLGVYALLFSGFIASIVMTGFFLRSDKCLLSSYFTPGFVFWLLLVLFCALIVSSHSFTVWDEFMHWGPLAKVMSIRADLLYGGYQLVHQSYPPGARLFYMMFFLPAGFDEGRAYIAQTLILFSPVAIVFRWGDWKKWRRSAALSIAIFLAILFLINSWVPVMALYLDVPVAFFVAGTYLFYSHSKRRALDIVLLSPLVFALLLLKAQLFPFVLLVLALVFSDLLVRRELALKKVGAIVLVLAVAFLSVWSWQYHLRSTGVLLEWSTAGLRNIVQMYQAILDPANHQAFVELKASAASQLPLCIMLVYLSILIPFLMRPGVHRFSWWMSSFIWFLGLFLYLFALIGFSLIMFKGYYGHSFSRYSAIYYLAWSFFVLDAVCVSLYERSFSIKLRYKQILFIFLSLGAASFLLYSHLSYTSSVKRGFNAAHLRKQVQLIASRVKELTPPESRVFTVWQNSSGSGRTMMLYDLFPRGYNYVPTSFGVVQPGQEGWSADLLPEAFMDRLRGYDYLLLAHDDAFFWDRYGDLLYGREPLVSYEYCEGGEFDSAMKTGCVLGQYQAYLFKVEDEGDRLIFINMINGGD